MICNFACAVKSAKDLIVVYMYIKLILAGHKGKQADFNKQLTNGYQVLLNNVFFWTMQKEDCKYVKEN